MSHCALICCVIEKHEVRGLIIHLRSVRVGLTEKPGGTWPRCHHIPNFTAGLLMTPAAPNNTTDAFALQSYRFGFSLHRPPKHSGFLLRAQRSAAPAAAENKVSLYCKMFYFVRRLNGLTPVVFERSRGVAGVHTHWFEGKHVGILWHQKYCCFPVSSLHTNAMWSAVKEYFIGILLYWWHIFLLMWYLETRCQQKTEKFQRAKGPVIHRGKEACVWPPALSPPVLV